MSLEPAVPPAEPSWTEREVVTLIKRSLDDSNANQKDMLRYMLAEQKASTARHADLIKSFDGLKAELVAIRVAVGDVDAGLDGVEVAAKAAAKAAEAGQSRPGLFAQVTGWLEANPTLKAAVVQTLVLLLGLLATGATAYATFHFGGFATTPTPVEVAQPVHIVPPVQEEAATPPESLYQPNPGRGGFDP